MRKNLLWTLICSFLVVHNIFAQEKKISGNVTSSEGETLPGVSVVILGTNVGVITNLDGDFEISVPESAEALTFSYVGMKTQTVSINNRTSINVILEPELVGLEEVVVTALGIEREKKALGYSVTEVNSDDLVSARESNIVNALAGKVAGVSISNSSGMAGSSSRIVIRGNSSLNFNNQPLFVIDGVPFDNTEYWFDEEDEDQALFYGGTANTGIDIDPNQIASMSVLKGASATALYGSRAANGVIMITTKDGKSGMLKESGPQVTFNSRYGWEDIIPPPYQDKYGLGFNGEYYDGEERKTYYVWGPRLDTMDVETYNHWDEFFKQGQTFENSLSVQGGSEKFNYYMSYANLNQEGTVPHNELDRNNIVANFSGKLSDKLKVNAKIGYIRTKNDRLIEGNSLSSVLWTILNGPVNYNFKPAVDENGEQRLYRSPFRNNHFWTADNTLFTDNRDRFTPIFGLDYEILPWIRLSGKVGVDYYTSGSKYYENTGNRGNYPTGRIDQTSRTSREINSDILLTISKDVSHDISMNFLLGNNINDRYYHFEKVQGTDFIIPEFYNLSNATVYNPVVGTTQSRSFSFYGQAEFAWRSALYLTVTGRNDWSSTLPESNNSYFYPSVSLGYVFSEMLSVPKEILTYGKIRLSYAQVGNDAPAYATSTSNITVNPGDGQRGDIIYPFDGVGSYKQSNIQGNPDLKPEITTEYEVGLDIRMLNNRFGIDFAYYNRVSKDQIFNAPVASSTGFLQKRINAGEITNKGIELLVDVTPIRTNGFSWDITVNYTKNKNEVVELTEGVESIRLAGFTSPGIFIRENTPYGVIWGTRYQRNDAGEVIIDDDESSPFYGMPLIEDDLGPIGYVEPDWIGGLRNTFSFKGLSVGAQVDIRRGGDIMNFDEYYTSFYGTSIQTEDRENPAMFPGGVKASDGSPNDIEVDAFDYYTSMGSLADEFMVQKSDYIKLREVSVGYKFPRTFLEKTPIAGLDIAFTGRNLWRKVDDSFTGSDPELSLYGSGNGQGFLNFQMPATKSYNISLKIIF